MLLVGCWLLVVGCWLLVVALAVDPGGIEPQSTLTSLRALRARKRRA